ncbi:MAG: ANTAR domain-containing protein [Clostridiales bacterium]|nr:ANTAR domain-containing protein [Clostridiales bacterium]
MERMIVAFDRQTVAQKISESLKLGGFHIAAVCGSCAEVLRWSDQRQVLVICGFKLPDGPCASLAELLPPQVPVLMVASAANLELVTDARIAKLAMPVSRRDFIGAVAALLEKNRRTDRRPPRTEQQEALIRQAKALLMAGGGLSEPQAHTWLQRQSMRHGVPIFQMAARLLQDPQQWLEQDGNRKGVL